MSRRQLRRVFGTLALLSFALRLSAAESPGSGVPIRWLGGPPAALLRVERLDLSNRVANAYDIASPGSFVELQDGGKGEKYRFTAAGFVPADVRRDRLAYGVLLRAFGSVLLQWPRDSRSPAPTTLTLHVVEDRADPRGVTRTVPASRHGEYTVPTPPGTWHLLIDAGSGAPTIVEGLRVGSGETLRVPLSSPGPARIETYSVADAAGKPIAGAELRWAESQGSPANALFARWIASRGLRTGRDGLLRIDRLPLSAHSWAVRAVGFRPRTVDVRSRDARLAQDPALVRIGLRPLPSLRIHLKRPTGESGSAFVSVWRIRPRGSVPGVDSSEPPAWRGEISSEAIAPGLSGGLYRAEVSLPGIVAAAERTIDESNDADDFQDLTVDVLRKLVRGKVTRSERPVPGVEVEAVPNDPTIGATTTRLARTKTGADGAFVLSFSYRGIVSITASTEVASKTKIVDLIADSEADASFDLRPGSIVLRAVDGKNGEPIAGAELATEFVPLGEFSEGIRMGSTDSTGQLRLEDLSDGLLKVTARAQGFATRIVRDIPVAGDADAAVPIELTRKVPFRIRVVDEFSAPVSNAEILVERDPHIRRPRICPLRSLGRTDDGGEIVLDELTGERTPAYAIAAGMSAQAFWLPGESDPDGGPDANTVDVVTAHHRTAPGIRVTGAGGGFREDAVLVFVRNGIEIPFSVISRAAQVNGLSPEVLFQRGDRSIHYHELLAPGRYAVEVLSPHPSAEGDPTRDVKDLLGTVLLPPDSMVELLWREDRAYPPMVPQ